MKSDFSQLSTFITDLKRIYTNKKKMPNNTNKRCSNALAENALVIVLLVVLSPCVHKNGSAHAFVLQQLPLYDYDAAPSVEGELLPVAQNKQKDGHNSAEPNNNYLTSEQQANFIAMATNTNGTIEKTSVFNDKQQQQQQREKKEATDQGRIHIFAGQRRTNFATTAGQKNEHQNSVEHNTNAQVRHNKSMESLG